MIPNLYIILASVSGRWPGEVTKEYGSRLLRGRKRIWLAACLRSQTNMACEPSEVTTEYVSLQYVSWLNMARGLSEVVTEYGLRALWDYNRICPAVICLLAQSLSKIVTEYGLLAKALSKVGLVSIEFFPGHWVKEDLLLNFLNEN